MTELEYLRGRVHMLETLLKRALPVLRLALLYPTLVKHVEIALLSSSSPPGELLNREASDKHETI